MLGTLVVILAVLLTGLPGAKADTVELVTGNGYPPFTDASLPEGGLVTEIVRTAYRRAGKEPELTFLAWKRAELAVQRGKAVATFPYVKTGRRLERYSFSNPVFVPEVVPIVAPADAGRIESVSDLKGLRTCMPVGWQVGVEEIDDMIDNGDITTFREYEMPICYRLLAHGRIDFIATERLGARVDARRTLGTEDAVYAEDIVLGTTPLHVIFDKDHPQTPSRLAVFNRGLKAIKEDGTYDDIVARHVE